jgi:hypothetical protein
MGLENKLCLNSSDSSKIDPNLDLVAVKLGAAVDTGEAEIIPPGNPYC